MELFRFVFIDHFVLACVAALWFVAGMVLAIPVARWDIKWLQRLPLWFFRSVLRLFGDQPSLLRMTLIIFFFNGSAMFIYMSSGVYPLVPKIIALMTGFNIAAFFVKSTEMEDLLDARAPSTAQWIPGPGLTILCGLVVILLELPCFWYAIAMGIKLGQIATSHGGYTAGFEERGRAYGSILIPILFASAICESIAVRGAGRLVRKRQKDSTDGP